MASIWTQGPGCPPKKLKGHLPAFPPLVQAELARYADKLARRNNATIVVPPSGPQQFEVFLRWPDGMMFSVFAEFFSPPSAAEPNEPRPTKGAKS